MKIPKKINILGTEYKVTTSKKLKNDDGEESDTHIGWTLEPKREIQIAVRNDLSKSLIEQTFYHECVHAMLFESGLSKCFTEDVTNEVFAQTTGNLIQQIIQQVK